MWKLLRLISEKYSYDVKMSHKLTTLILFMVAIPVILLGILFYSRSEKMIRDEIGYSYGQILIQYTENINYKLHIYHNLMDNIVMNRTIQKIYVNQDQSTHADTVEIGGQISGEIDSLLYGKNIEEIYSIQLYAVSDSFPNDGRYINNLSTVRDEPWYDRVVRHGSGEGYFLSTSEGLKRQLLSFIRPINNISSKRFNDRLGLVKLDLDAEKLFDADNTLLKVKCDEIFILDQQGKPIISGINNSNTQTDLLMLNEIAGSNQIYDEIAYKGRKQIVVHKEIEKYGWKVLFVFPYSEIEKKILDTGIPILFAIILIILVLIGFIIAFTRLFSQRIRKLIDKMRKVQEGDLKITETIKGRDELGTVDANFNVMVGRLNDLITENYIEKLERREAELNVLQMQINPHFLYNTLETIKSIAYLYGCTEVCTMSQNLGNMFRYSINMGKSEFVRLKDEIQSIRNYISIQSIRFDHRFEIAYNIPDEYMMCHVLKLILQPIVENSFIHGFKGKKQGERIDISVGRTKGDLAITITDNGRGMTHEQLKLLRAFLNDKEGRGGEENKKSIGIKNVNSRIKLVYGDPYGILIDSTENEGTEVYIILPYRI